MQVPLDLEPIACKPSPPIIGGEQLAPVSPVGACGAAPSPAPTASRKEIAALEQLLRLPESQAIVRDFGSASASAVPGGNAVADSIIQRYGPDLAARLNQLHQARNAVRQQYLDAMNAMRQARQQLGKAIVNRINYDLREFNHACNTGDWRRAGQQFGLMVNALAQAADGAQGLTRGAQAAARGGARLARRGWRRWASRLEMATLRRAEPGGFRLGPWGTWAALALCHLARERPPHQAAQPIWPLAWNWGWICGRFNLHMKWLKACNARGNCRLIM